MRRLIAVVGMPGAGKGTVVDYLSQKNNWPVIHFGQMVYDEVKKRGLKNIQDEIFVRNDMRLKEGSSVLAKRVAQVAQRHFANDKKIILLDGLYSWDEYLYLADSFGQALNVIAVVTDKLIRRQRARDRKDGHRQYSTDQLIGRELDEIVNLQKGDPIAYADFYILNNGTTKQLYSQLDKLNRYFNRKPSKI